MAYNSPRPAQLVVLAQRRQLLQVQSDATSPVGGGAPTDAATLQGHTPAYFATAAALASGLATKAAVPFVVVAGSEPVASITYYGKLMLVVDQSTPAPTIIKMCVINSGGGYEWVALGQSS